MDLIHLPHTIWKQLALAKDDRQHPWRTPVLASIDSSGLPHARTVVLRNVDSDSQVLQFFTDSRSPKVTQLSTSPQAQIVFWSKALNWQLRVTAQITIETTGVAVDAAWRQVEQSPARQDYLSPLSPGDALAAEAPKELGHSHHLAIISAKVTHIDWLSLSPEGHQRAEISAGILRWLTP
jgi:hypothetical protein